MQCVVVAGRHPVYELTAADLVVRQLDELSFINLKQLFRMESMVASQVGEPLIFVIVSSPLAARFARLYRPNSLWRTCGACGAVCSLVASWGSVACCHYQAAKAQYSWAVMQLQEEMEEEEEPAPRVLTQTMTQW